jgi:protein JSN1
MTMEETDQVAGDFLDGEIVDLASDSLKVASMHLA